MTLTGLRLAEMVALGGGGVALAAWGQHGQTTSRRRPESSSWATRRDLADLVVPADTPGRIPLGEYDRRTLAALSNHHVLGVGASQSFKTSGLAVHAVRAHTGPQLVLSAKPDLFYATVDPTDVRHVALDLTGELPAVFRTIGWSPLDGSADPLGALRLGEMVARSASPSDVRASSFWTERGGLFLAGLFCAYAQHPAGHDMADVIRCAIREDVEEPAEILRSLPGELPDQLADALEAVNSSKAKEYRGGVFATVQSALSVYLDPRVLQASRDPGRFRPGMLRDGTLSRLYVVGSMHDQRRLTPMVLAFLDEIERDWSAAHLHRGRTPYQPAERLLLVLDEATQLAPIRNLPQLLAVAAGIGINVLLLLQDVAQLLALYGQHGARDILGNCHAKLLMSGVTDQDTLDVFRAALGDEQVAVPTVTRSSGRGQRSRTTGSTLQRMPLAEVSDLRQQEPGTGILVYLHRKPARGVKLNPQPLETL